jgi:hypothetical protein
VIRWDWIEAALSLAVVAALAGGVAWILREPRRRAGRRRCRCCGLEWRVLPDPVHWRSRTLCRACYLTRRDRR